MKMILIASLLLGLTGSKHVTVAPSTLDIIADPSAVSTNDFFEASGALVQAVKSCKLCPVDSETRVAFIKGLSSCKTEDTCLELIRTVGMITDLLGDPDIGRSIADTISRISPSVDSAAISFLSRGLGRGFGFEGIGQEQIDRIILALPRLPEADAEFARRFLLEVTHREFADSAAWQSWWKSDGKTFSIVTNALSVVCDETVDKKDRSFAIAQTRYHVLNGSQEDRAMRAAAERVLLQLTFETKAHSQVRYQAFCNLRLIYASYSEQASYQLLIQGMDTSELRNAAFQQIRAEPQLLKSDVIRIRILALARDPSASRLDRAQAVFTLAEVEPDAEALTVTLNVAEDVYRPGSSDDRASIMVLAALRHLTKQEFGDDFGKWRGWIGAWLAKQPSVSQER